MKPEGRGSHRGARVCRWPEAQNHVCADERSVRRVSADAEPSVEKPEDRQSERSEVCRDRAKGKYLLPEGRAGRRAAVVRRVPEAERKSFGMVSVPGASKRSAVAPGTGHHEKGKAGGPRQSPRSACLPMARRLRGAPLGGGRERVLSASRGGAKCGPAGDCNREGGRGAAGGTIKAIIKRMCPETTRHLFAG